MILAEKCDLLDDELSRLKQTFDEQTARIAEGGKLFIKQRFITSRFVV